MQTPLLPRATVCESLQQTLVELAALASHTKQAQWNISGPNFMGVHLYLDQLTDVLRQRFDDVGERIAALGGSPDARPITVSESTTLSSIPAGPLDVGSALGMRRGQTELGALVIDADSGTPFSRPRPQRPPLSRQFADGRG